MVNLEKTQNKKQQEKRSFYQYIIDEIKKNPLSQGELRNSDTVYKINKDNITIQGVKSNLDRAVRKREIAYIGKSQDAKLLLKKEYNKDWENHIRQYYLHTPESGRLYQYLIENYSDKKKNDELIGKIVDIYRGIEVASKYQKFKFTDFNAVKQWLLQVDREVKPKKLRKNYTDEYINYKIKRQNEKVKKFHKSGKRVVKRELYFKQKKIRGHEYYEIAGHNFRKSELNRFLDLLNMEDSWMYWCAYRDPVDQERFTIPMIEKMIALFVKIK